MPPAFKRWVLLIVFAVAVAAVIHRSTRRPAALQFVPGTKEFLTNALRVLQEDEAEKAQKYWGPELAAQKRGEVIETLWDSLNSASNKFEVLQNFPVSKLIWAKRGPARELPHSIRILDGIADQVIFSRETIRQLLQEKGAAGWHLAQCEFRHMGFSPEKRASTFYFSAHLENLREQERAILEGDLLVKWEGSKVLEVDASNVQLRMRKGPTPFILVLDREVAPPYGSFFIDPLIVYDLEGDGRPEVILAARNEVYRWSSNGEWNTSPLCEADPRLIFTGIISDFNGDGAVDFLSARFDGLFMHEGAGAGKFPNPARLVWQAKPRLKYAQAITSGDIDGDGDLDLFLGQYKLPYEKGNMPFPYFNANDGHPSFLLLNDGKGNFSDVTDQRGFGPKSHRRVYSSSLVDLDRDNDLDLIVVSDFAGLDAFENDSKGFFSEATRKWGLETHAFGMAHYFSDFDADGFMDILLIGMTSPVAERLEGMKLTRPYEVSDTGMRRLAHGNRLFFGQAQGAFAERPLSAQVSRTGWSWGCSGTDFDGDGFPDIYIANGHETRQMVHDYETEFWLHDIYVGNSQENYLAEAYFKEKEARTRGRGWSYGGYEKNRFFLNQSGTNFTEVGFLLGVALEADSRNVVARDLNGDGAPELIVMTFEVFPKIRQTLKIFENRLPQAGRPAPPTFKVNGDSFRSQSQ